MDTLEDYVTKLIPVSEWVWWLYRITYHGSDGDTRVRFLVSTDTHLDSEVQDRWPSDHLSSYTWDIMARAKPPRQLWCPILRREYPEDAWECGERQAAAMNINKLTPIPEEFLVMD